MRILFLTSRLPYPPDRGDRLRVYHLLRTLSADHELTLVSFTESPRPVAVPPELESLCERVVVVPRTRNRSLATVAGHGWRRLPLQALYYRSRTMQRILDRELAAGRFDMAYVHLFRMAPYLPPGRVGFRLVDLTDVVSQEIARSLPYRSWPSRFVYAAERRRIERYEVRVAEDADETWLISEPDRQALLDRCPRARARVVPNGVDCDRFQPLADVRERPELLLTGHMGVFHNQDAARFLVSEILPLVRRRHPDCGARLVGAAPPRWLAALGERDGVEVTGFRADLNRELNRAAVFVAPLRFSAGAQNKVLEAMAAGRAVVTTSAVAAGVGAEPGRDVVVGASAVELAGLTADLLDDPDRRRTLGDRARRLVRERFRWSAAAERVREIARELGA